MAYAVYESGSDPALQTPSQNFRPLERVAVVLGAAGFGAGVGFMATMALGVLEPWMAAACAAPVYLTALYLALEGAREAAAKREWFAALMGSLLLAGLSAWPIAAMYAAADAPLYWVGPAASLTILALFVLLAAGQAPRVFRAGALGALIAVLAANQGLLTLMGA